MDIKLKIGLRIKDLRESKKISQKDLSFLSDLDRSYIASIENGKRNVSIINIQKISNAFGITIKDFFLTNIFDNEYTNSSQ